MKIQYALVLMHHDSSGVIATFGPYETAEDADEARERLDQLPLERGQWTVKQLIDMDGEPE